MNDDGDGDDADDDADDMIMMRGTFAYIITILDAG